MDAMAAAERNKPKDSYPNPTEYDRVQSELKIVVDKVTSLSLTTLRYVSESGQGGAPPVRWPILILPKSKFLLELQH